MAKNKIKIDGTVELNQEITYLEDVLKGLKAGTVHVQLGAESVELHPRSVVDFEMAVAQKKGREKIEIEIEWETDESGQGQDMKISSSGPTIEIS